MYVVDGSASINLGKLSAGDYEISVYYAGNGLYFNQTNTTAFNVNKAPTITQVANFTDIKVGEDETFDVTIDPSISCEANVYINDELNNTIKITEGKGKVVISKLGKRHIHNKSGIHRQW